MNRRWELFESIRRATDDFFQRLSVGPPPTSVALAALGPFPPMVPNHTGPRNTAAVLDVSGSMGLLDYPPSRLDGGICATLEYTDARAKMSPGDRIAIVSFSTVARVVLPLTPVTDRKTIVRALRQLTADGGTDIAEGLRATTDIFENELPSGRQRHAIVLTDGQGGQPLEAAARLKKEFHVVIEVVGIGGSPREVNEALLRQVATTDPNGFCHYRFIKDPETLSEHYKALAKGLLWRGGGE